MKARPVALLAIIVAATLAEVFHALRRRAQDSQLRQISAALDQQLAETRPTERTLRRVRDAVNQMHQHIDPVPKGAKKAAS